MRMKGLIVAGLAGLGVFAVAVGPGCQSSSETIRETGQSSASNFLNSLEAIRPQVDKTTMSLNQVEQAVAMGKPGDTMSAFSANIDQLRKQADSLRREWDGMMKTGDKYFAAWGKEAAASSDRASATAERAAATDRFMRVREYTQDSANMFRDYTAKLMDLRDSMKGNLTSANLQSLSGKISEVNKLGLDVTNRIDRLAGEVRKFVAN